VIHKILLRDELDEENRDVARFLRLADNFGTSLPDFADHLIRYSDSVVYDDRAEAVILMTIHASKGLEFPVVFLTGAEEGILPLSPGADFSPEEIIRHVEEERRLFYVGMTRAEKILYLSSVEIRQVKGEMIKQVQSRFVEEIRPEYLLPAPGTGSGKRKIKPRTRQLSLF
jgi:superfamily I DNA/RNA helicase